MGILFSRHESLILRKCIPLLAIVNENKCQQLADLISRFNLPEDREPIALDLNLDIQQISTFYLIVVAICHQTTPKDMPALEGLVNNEWRRGWDYLVHRFQKAVQLDRILLNPKYLSQFGPKQLELLVNPTGDPGVVLTNIARRASLIRNLGDVMVSRCYNSAHDLYSISDGYLIRDDEQGLLQLLKEFNAYVDPIYKKSFFFISLMKNHGIWQYQDDDNLGPPIDYHEIRFHLRYGTVEFSDRRYHEKILNGYEVDQHDDIKIRKAVSEAITHVSKQSKQYSVSQLHYFFWNLARSCCMRFETHCYECPTSCSLPSEYAKLEFSVNQGRCLVQKHCKSRDNPKKIDDYFIKTEFY